NNTRQKKWTVMVYMDADGNLEQYGILNMNQMESVGSNANVNLVVQFDRHPDYDTTNGNWTGTRRYLVTRDNDGQNITSPVLQDLGEVDMGQPSSLNEFITWAKTTYPADHYCLVLWNHGAGWRSRNLPVATRGILFDDTSGSYLTMPALQIGLETSQTHFDLIAVDCSLMGMLEVAYQIKDQTDYITFSEESPPGSGYPYDKILGALAANPTMDAEAFGRVIVAQYVGAYPNMAVTQSLILTANVPEFAKKVDALATAILPTLSQYRAEFSQARSSTQAYAFSYYRDLFDFARNIKARLPVDTVTNAADAVMQGLSVENGGPVVAEAHNSTAMQHSHGLSIYMPGDNQYYPSYKDLRLSSNYPNWMTLLMNATQYYSP
ncbi:MAG TPA: clostripain-related cysteine peptidase, partial [Armatimonadota bacterium]|nr:clostripain-related cysteine peptidase [Armatimonadota bacterium]